MFLSSIFVGCLYEEQYESQIDITVVPDMNNGTIIESYSDGEQVSASYVVIDFDFSQTTSGKKITTYGIDTMDGRTPHTAAADTHSSISVEFYQHGVYNVSAFAIDEDNFQQNTSLLILIELRIDWVESNTSDPIILTYNPTPVNGGPNPVLVEINSVVENPRLIENIGGGGQSVEITWNLVDEQDGVCQKKTTQIDDGQSESWYTIHFNTFQVHELVVNYDEGQDYINVNHSIKIIYAD